MSCAGCDDCTITGAPQLDAVPYEFHVTVAPTDKWIWFSEVCRRLSIKPLFLKNYGKDGSLVQEDLMTRSTKLFHPEELRAYRVPELGPERELQRIANRLSEAGFQVVRMKAEAAPWHPDVSEDQRLREGHYFECHIDVHTGFRQALASLSPAIHISASQTSPPGAYMATLRSIPGQTLSEFKFSMSEVLPYLEPYRPGKQIIEYAAIDTNPEHDAAWLSA